MRYVRIGRLVFIGFLLLITSLPSVAQDNSTTAWSAAKFLGTGWWQNVTLDQEGNLHVSWYDGIYTEENDLLITNDLLMYAELPINGDWKPGKDVIYTGTGGYTVRNAMAVTSDGRLHAVYRNNTFHRFANSHAFNGEQAASWSRPININNGGYYIDMMADRNDVLHIIYGGSLGFDTSQGEGNIEKSGCPFCSDPIYRRSVDGGRNWSNPTPLEITPEGGSDRLSIFEGGSGRLYITWDEGYDWYAGRGQPKDVRFAYSEDGGLTWTDPISLDGGNYPDRKPVQFSMVEMRDGTLMALWRYSTDLDRNIYYQFSDDVGETWTAPEAVPGIVARSINDSPLDHYDVEVDSLGNIHLFAVAQPNLETITNPALYYLSFQEGIWGRPQRVFFDLELSPEWPEAEVGLSNDLHLTWFVREYLKGPGGVVYRTDKLEVYYSHLPGAIAPRATLAFSPTETALPTATVFQNLDPTPTAFPTITLQEEYIPVVTVDRYATDTFLGGVMFTGLFCAVVGVAVHLRRRR